MSYFNRPGNNNWLKAIVSVAAPYGHYKDKLNKEMMAGFHKQVHKHFSDENFDSYIDLENSSSDKLTFNVTALKATPPVQCMVNCSHSFESNLVLGVLPSRETMENFLKNPQDGKLGAQVRNYQRTKMDPFAENLLNFFSDKLKQKKEEVTK